MLPLSMVLSLFVFSCAKTPSGVRTVKQTGQQIVSPQVSGPSVNAANAQNIAVDVVTVERPESTTDGSLSVTSELKLPNGSYIPVTTTHTNGSEAYGQVDIDTQTKLDVRSGCFETNCAKYIMLITVVKSNYAVHQIAVISKLADSFFYIKHINATVAPNSLYRGSSGVSPVQQVYNEYKNL